MNYSVFEHYNNVQNIIDEIEKKNNNVSFLKKQLIYEFNNLINERRFYNE